MHESRGHARDPSWLATRAVRLTNKLLILSRNTVRTFDLHDSRIIVCNITSNSALRAHCGSFQWRNTACLAYRTIHSTKLQRTHWVRQVDRVFSSTTVRASVRACLVRKLPTRATITGRRPWRIGLICEAPGRAFRADAVGSFAVQVRSQRTPLCRC